ncbi:MAG: DUF1631 domain-containing protein [Pedobacter sp.]|nr:DUF1631 domain-containing protein [Pedobacter sp.]
MTDNVKPSPDTGRSRIQAPAVLDAVRSRGVQRLDELLKSMFGRLESIVFEWARTLPDSEQQPYMDVIVVVRTKRAEMESRFIAGMATAFMQLLQGAAEKKTTAQGGLGAVDFSSLSLVNTDEMDISVMVDTMVARARMDYAASLGLLRRRYAHVLSKVEITDRNMPLDPGPVTSAFKDTLSLLDVGVPEKLLVLRVFQQQLLGELGGLLDEANQLFIDAGVLPELKVAFAGGAAAKKPAASKTEAAAKPQAANTEEIFSFLQGLLGQGVMPGMPGVPGAGAMPGLPAGAAGMPVGTSYPSMPGAQFHAGHYVGGGGIGAIPAATIGGSVAAVPIAPLNIAPTAVVQTVATPELVALLSQIQQHQPKAKLAEDDSSPSVEAVRGNIRDSLRSDEEAVEAIKQADEDVINLVSMLFDFILDDDDLPTAMKALIGRLQIPLLKVAILDKSFFNAETHPARRLLNALAKAGIGWSNSGQGDDVLYAKIEEVVFRILNEFIDELDLFEELLDEFTAFHEQQQKREDAVDKRTRETEEGRARAELARAMVQQTLNRRLTGRQLPLVVVKLLQDAWRNVLYINCLKDGTESEAWKQSVKVVDALIWSVVPQPGGEWKQRLADVAPKLVNSIKKGLAAVSYDVLKTETLLRELSQVHLGLMRGEEARTVNVLDARNARAEAPGQVAAAEVAGSDAASVAAVVLPEAEQLPAQVEAPLSGDDQNVLLVSRLNVGSWVEFIEPEKQDRHKLVARIRSVDKLIFANRRGIKVGEMTGMKLAVDMSVGRARVVEEGEFIDRALESVIGNLRDLGSKAVPGSK